MIDVQDNLVRKVVYVITTGGTIEKVYSEQTGSVANVDGKLDRYLGLLRLPDCEVRILPLLNKDSREMTDADRVLILGMVRGLLQESAPIVITHGTDTMVQTGLYLQRALADLAIPIVMTGAMVPLGFEDGDGLQNLTESLFAIRVLRPGIYVVMHNQVFPVHRVRKNEELGLFVWLDSYVM
jgi:L-asparaginase